ncbi:MAG: chemotaxis protein, partial [Massilia sp.]|nr:chemotaxis protein [Massilia sp.]
MGFASKLSMGFSPRGKLEPEVAQTSPDTQLGPNPDAAVPPLRPVPAAGPADASNDAASPLSLGGIMRRKRAAAPNAEEPAQELQLPLIGHLSLARQLRILLLTFVIGILLAIVALWQNSSANVIASAQTQIASDALMHSQRVGKAAPNAIQGNPDAFAQLDESRIALTADLNLLARGGEFAGHRIPSPSAGMARALAEARTKWTLSDNSAGTIL